MIFQNPTAWYFLPVILLPLLLNLYLINRRNPKVLPSLYFYHQLVNRKAASFRHLSWLMLILETLFLLGVVVLLAKPNVGSLSEDKKLMVLLDDSPSMSYYFQMDSEEGWSNNKLYVWLKKYLDNSGGIEGRFVEIKKLSEINESGSVKVESKEDLDRYFSLMKTENKRWLLNDLIAFFRNSSRVSSRLGSDYDYILYSDLKANHFLSSKPNGGGDLGLGSLDELDDFTANLFIIVESGAPILTKLNLSRINYFSGEKLNFDLNLKSEKDFSLELLLNKKSIFTKKYTATNQVDIEEAISFPLGVSSKVNQKLEVLLKKEGVPYQNHREIFYNFNKKKLGFVDVGKSSKSSSKSDYFNLVKSLFAYDLLKGHVTLQKVTEKIISRKSTLFDTVFLLFPFREVSSGASLAVFNQSGSKIFSRVVFLSPDSGVATINQWLRNQQLKKLEFRDKRYFKSTDKMVFSEFDERQTKNFELRSLGDLGSEIGVERYLTVSIFSGSRQKIYPILSVNDNPIIFIYQNTLFISLFRPYDLLEQLNPNYLNWIYEGIFTLWKNSKGQASQRGNEELEQSNRRNLTSRELLLEAGADKVANIEDYLPNVRVLSDGLKGNQADKVSGEEMRVSDVGNGFSLFFLILLLETFLILVVGYFVSRKIIDLWKKKELT